ncbi:helix-turn-helix domain-containing protein [Sphingobacterium sp. NPDC055431]
MSVKRTLECFDIHRSTFYIWYPKYLKNGYEGLKMSARTSKRQWNWIS